MNQSNVVNSKQSLSKVLTNSINNPDSEAWNTFPGAQFNTQTQKWSS